VVADCERMLVVHLPVDLRKKQRLIAGAGDDAGEALKEREAVGALCRGDAAPGERREFGRAQRSEERRRVRRHCRSGEVARLLIAIEEEEQLVLLDGPADADAVLLAAVIGLDAD